jgi:hypothetical protein
LAALNAPAATVRALAFTADGNVLASGSDDGAVLLSYFDNHTEPISLQAHDGFVRALAFSGSRLASAGDDGKVKIWTAAPGAIWKPSEGKQPLVCQAQPGSILALAFTPNGGSVVSGGRNGMITVWDASTGRVRGLLPGHKGAVKALAIHPHGENLISGGADAALLRWRSAGAKESSPDFPANAEGPIQVGQTPPPDGPTGQPEGDGARIPQGGRGWLVAVALISLIAVLVVAGGLGVGLYVRKNKKANKARASTKEKQGDESSSRILLQCPKCDRKLKVKFALAGKHVKCMCGAAVPVPAAKTPSTAP